MKFLPALLTALLLAAGASSAQSLSVLLPTLDFPGGDATAPTGTCVLTDAQADCAQGK